MLRKPQKTTEITFLKTTLRSKPPPFSALTNECQARDSNRSMTNAKVCEDQILCIFGGRCELCDCQSALVIRTVHRANGRGGFGSQAAADPPPRPPHNP